MNNCIEVTRTNIVLLCLSVLAFLIIYINMYNVNFVSEEICTEKGRAVEDTLSFSPGEVIRQSVYIHEKNRIKNVYIRFNEYAEDGINCPVITVSLRDKRDNIIVSKDIETNQETQNGYTGISLDNVELNGVDRYYLAISCPEFDAAEYNSPSVHMCRADKVNDIMYVNDKRLNGKAVDAYYVYTTVTPGLEEILIFLMVLTALSMLVFLKIKYKYLSGIFVVLCVFIHMWVEMVIHPDKANVILYDNGVSVTTVICILTLISSILIVRNRYGERRTVFCSNIEEPRMYVIRIVLGITALFILSVCQLKIAGSIYQKNGWDVGTVYDIAKKMYEAGDIGKKASYLSLFPNNRALVMVFYYLMKIFNTTVDSEIYWHLIQVNIILIDAALVLMFFIAKKLFSTASAVIAFAMGVLLIGLSGWIVVPYTDTMTMWNPLLQLWLYLLMRNNKNIYYRTGMAFVLGVVCAVGYYLKPQCVIVTIGIAIISLFRFIVKKIKAKSIMYIFSIAAGFVLFAVMFNYQFDIISNNKVNYSKSVPASHFMMMGAAENPVTPGIGGFDVDSTLYYTYRYKKTHVKNEKCIERLKYDLKNYGVAGYISHLWQKAEWVLGDGSFAWLVEGEFFTDDYSEDNTSGIREYFIGKKDGGVTTRYRHFGIINGIWLAGLLFFVIPFGMSRKDYEDVKWLIWISAAGCVLFTLIFEGRSRYLINYIPFFLIIMSSSLYTLLSERVTVAGRLEGTKNK